MRDATAAGVVGQVEAFAAAIRGEGREVPGAIESARATAIGHAVREAARTGEAVTVSIS